MRGLELLVNTYRPMPYLCYLGSGHLDAKSLLIFLSDEKSRRELHQIHSESAYPARLLFES